MCQFKGFLQNFEFISILVLTRKVLRLGCFPSLVLLEISKKPRRAHYSVIALALKGKRSHFYGNFLKKLEIFIDFSTKIFIITASFGGRAPLAGRAPYTCLKWIPLKSYPSFRKHLCKSLKICSKTASFSFINFQRLPKRGLKLVIFLRPLGDFLNPQGVHGRSPRTTYASMPLISPPLPDMDSSSKDFSGPATISKVS